MLKEGDDYFWYLTDGGDNVYVYDDETSYEDFVFPAIVSGELKRRLLLIMEMKYPSKTFWHSAECERHTVDAFNQYGSCVMELPMKERKELDGVDITEVINKAYYDWNPFLVRIVDKGYGFQTYCVRKSQEWDGQRFVRFSRGENDGIKMEINSTNAFL